MKNKTYQIGVITLSLMMMLAASCGRQEEQGIVDSDETTTAVSETTISVETPACTEAAIPAGALISRHRVTAVSADGEITLGDVVIGAGYDFYDADGNKLPVKGNIAVGDWLEIIHDDVMGTSIPAYFGQIYQITRVTG